MLTVTQAFDLAQRHHHAGRLAEAEGLYGQILAVQPNHAAAHHFLGIAAYQAGHHDLAVERIGKAIALDPNDASAHSNLGEVYRVMGRHGDAIACFHRALELQPNYAEAAYNLGLALGGEGRNSEAVTAYRQAITLKPGHPQTHNNLGNTLAKIGRFDEAISALQRAIELQPDYAEAYSNLGGILAGRGRLDEAIGALRQSLALKPDSAEACNNLGYALKAQGRLDEAIATYFQARQFKPDDAGVQSNIILALHFHPDQDSGAIAREQRRWNERFSQPLKNLVFGHDRDPERPLRVGYVSPDFCHHILGRSVMPLFRHHDAAQFEVICYSGVMQPDALTAEFQRHARQWRHTVGLTDEAVAEMIRQDAVDILVDLTQHMGGNRLRVFARQPAPVQVSFAGYPESTGVEAIGYRISDRWLEAGASEIGDRRSEIGVPNSEFVPNSEPDLPSPISHLRPAERVFLLDSFWCYDTPGMEIEMNALKAKVRGFVTFGCLNSLAKVNEFVLKLWARVLCAVDDSRLTLLSPEGSHRQRTLDFLENAGVDRIRVEFVTPRPLSDYLELYHHLDVILDTFPYNGHTTSLDALWLGVPVVSLAGQRAVSRAGLSQAANLGLRELVAFSEDEFVRIAIDLARNPERLAELRATLRSRMQNSALMNAPQFARQIETAYRAMWRRWCAEAH